MLMIDELYVLARLHELSRACAQIAAERRVQATLAAPSRSVPRAASSAEPQSEALASLASV